MKLNPNVTISRCTNLTPPRCATSPSKVLRFGVREWVSQWGGAIAQFLLHGGEPKISQKRDRAGNLYYKVCDPVTQQHFVFDSELEVRIWLEQRYNSTF